MTSYLIIAAIGFSIDLVVSTSYHTELELLRQKGELRKACSKYGHAIQPVKRVNSTMRLRALRKLMASEVILGTLPVEAYLVTSSDEHQSTDVDDCEKRREYISGFSGSHGDAVVTMNKAALWTDGRFHLQADEEIDCNWLLFREGHKDIPNMSQWLKKELSDGGRIGLNPKLVSEYTWQKLTSEFKGTRLELVALNMSLIDEIWPVDERPKRRSKEAFILNQEYSGKSYQRKVDETRRELRKHGADAMVVTSLDEIAWLLNIRGRDVPYSPFLRSYVIFDMTKIFLYVNSSQVKNRNVVKSLNLDTDFLLSDSVQLKNYSDIWKDLRILSQVYRKILVPSHCVYSEGASHAVYEHIFRECQLPLPSPIIYLKAKKNSVEKRKMQEANVKDAAAVCDCFAYVEKMIKTGESLSELDVVKLLNEFRFEQRLSLGNSFRTIVAFGLNAAFPQYEPTYKTNTRIGSDNTLVLDSGGQYLGGTTDVTRTLHFGKATNDMKEAYTRVLIGLINLSTLKFPKEMKMAMADGLVRASLWEVGLDYLHETGHGVGAFLGVRESPIQVHFDYETSMNQTFKPGYFLSSEPGYYREGEFGVRLENILEVIEKPDLSRDEKSYLGFKVVTLVPFEPNLMKFELLSPHQIRWINSYHSQIRDVVGEELKRQGRMDGYEWMMEKTKYIPENKAVMLSSKSMTVLFINYIFLKLII